MSDERPVSVSEAQEVIAAADREAILRALSVDGMTATMHVPLCTDGRFDRFAEARILLMADGTWRFEL